MKHNKQSHIRVFISSTFLDMQRERELLVKYVFPKIQELCNDQGIHFAAVDLRWGITEKDAAEGNIIPLCFREIEQCQPYFIGILGSRYGTSINQIPATVVSTYPWLKDYHGKSITELEFFYGILNQPFQSQGKLFFFRSDEYLNKLPEEALLEDFASNSEEQKQKLNQLKARVLQEGLPVSHYNTPEEFSDLILQQLTELVRSHVSDNEYLSPIDQENLKHELYAKIHSRIYIGRKKHFDLIDNFINSNERTLVISGPSGIGKTALLASWITHYDGKYKPDRLLLHSSLWYRIQNNLLRLWKRILLKKKYKPTLIISHFVGATYDSTNWFAIIKRFMTILKQKFEVPFEVPQDSNGLRTTFSNWLHFVAQKGKVTFVIDGLNHLLDREQAQALGWLPEELPKGVQFILTTTEDRKEGRPYSEIERRKWKSYNISYLNRREIEQFTNDYLSFYGKKLEGRYLERVSLHPQTKTSVFLRTFLEELRVYGEFGRLEDRVDYYLEAESTEALFVKMIDRLELDYNSQRSNLVQESTQLLWAARKGLSEHELLTIMGDSQTPLPHIFWSPLFLTLKPFINYQSGILSLLNEHFKSAIKSKYLKEDKYKFDAHQKIVAYFSQTKLNKRVIEELPWHLTELKDWKTLFSLFSNVHYIQNSWQNHEYEVKYYWSLIEEKTTYKKLDAYRSVITSPEKYKDHLWPICKLLGDTGEAEEALQILPTLENEAQEKLDWMSLQGYISYRANLLEKQEKLEVALEAINQQEIVCQQFSSEIALAACYGNKGAILLRLNKREGALEYFQKEEKICEKNNDFFGLSINKGNQGIIKYDEKKYSEALILFQKQEKLSRMLGNLSGVQNSLDYQAVVYSKTGKIQKAVKAFDQSREICEHLGDLYALQENFGKQALLYQELADYDKAFELLEKREEICMKLEDNFKLCLTLKEFGIFFDKYLNEKEQAKRYFKRAYHIADKFNYSTQLEDILKLETAIEGNFNSK